MAEMKSVFDAKAKDFFRDYINNASPTGHESSGQQKWLNYLKPYIDDYGVDHYGTTFGIINPDAKYKVAIEAHADEISWMVHHITDEGFVYLLRNGGSDHIIAPSKRVNIYGDDGIVKGIFGWPAIHLRNKAKDTIPNPTNIFLDLGCKSKKEVLDLGVNIGHIAVYEDELMELNDRYYVGKALDNKAGGWLIAQVARFIKETGTKLPYSLYVVNSVQEEVGLRGAKMFAEKFQPNAAIVTDVGHDTNTPMLDPKVKGDYKCGGGPIVAFAPAVQNNLLKLILEAAKENNIQIQREANSRSTGTDADSFAYAVGGIPSALISLPLRYMHTTVETVNKTDIINVADLIFRTLLKIEDGHDFRYFS